MALTFVVAGTGTPSTGAPECAVKVPAGDTAALRKAFDDVQDDADDAGCTTWELRIAGTYVLDPDDGPLWHEADVPLRVVGPADGTARIAAGGAGTRLIDALDGALLTLERLVLADGSVASVGGDDVGGAVLADAVELIDSELIDNSATEGGAVYAREVQANRVSFVGNGAVGGAGEGGAIRATARVTLVNVTFVDNSATEGGAVWLLGSGSLTATFVTFVGNSATASGADLYVDDAPGERLQLRGILFGGTGSGLSCGGDGFPDDADDLDAVDSFAVDESCAGVTGGVDPLTFTTVPFLPGTSDLRVPDGGPVAIGQVACGGVTVDQRGVARPQGETCDAGAVERVVTGVTEEPEEPEDDGGSSGGPSGGGTSGPADVAPVDEVPDGPVPTSVPAGDGSCADGCPAFSPR